MKIQGKFIKGLETALVAASLVLPGCVREYSPSKDMEGNIVYRSRTSSYTLSNSPMQYEEFKRLVKDKIYGQFHHWEELDINGVKVMRGTPKSWEEDSCLSNDELELDHSLYVFKKGEDTVMLKGVPKDKRAPESLISEILKE